MNKLIILISLSLMTVVCSAQEDDHEWAVFDFYVGASLPMGKFGQKDINDGGYARTGFALGVGPNWYLNRNWGVFFHLGYQSNSVDQDALEQDLVESLPAVESYQGGNYSSILAMLGPSYTFRFTDRLRWMIKAGGGLFTAFQSDVQLTVNGITDVITSDSKFIFTGYAGTSLSYKISKKLSVLVNADFVDANPEFQLKLGDLVSEPARQRQTYLNMGAGISLNLE